MTWNSRRNFRIHIELTKQDRGPEDAEMAVGPEQMQPLSSYQAAKKQGRESAGCHNPEAVKTVSWYLFVNTLTRLYALS